MAGYLSEGTAEIRTVAVADLKPAPYNPRRIDPAAMAGLTKSLERFGYVEPIIWNQRSGFVVGGHQRLKVLRAKRIKQVPVVIVDLDENEEKALNLALNNPAITGEFSDKLGDLLAEVEQANSTLFADLRLDQLLAEADAKRRKFLAQDDLDEAPEPPAVPVTQAGDIWTLGRHRLVCGDSTDPAVIAALLGDERVDSLVTDPPYGVDYAEKNAYLDEYAKIEPRAAGKRIKVDIQNDISKDYRPWFASWLRGVPWAAYATIYVFMSSLVLHELRGAFDDAGLTWGDYLVWLKNGAVFGRKDYHAAFEMILYGWPKRHRFYGGHSTSTALPYGTPHKNDLHPTMKPIALLEQLLNDGSPNGSIILDLFGGSGSTLIACEASARRCRMVEIDPAYCDVIRDRWQSLTGGKATLNAPAP